MEQKLKVYRINLCQLSVLDNSTKSFLENKSFKAFPKCQFSLKC